MTDPKFDILTMGRSSIDLYANEIGVPFHDIKNFAAYVGGCPTNISVGTRRLNLRTALLTAVGNDPVGDFILKFLESEGVATEFIPRKAGRRTSAVILGIEPPDKFPLVFYRDNCADIELTIADVLAAPIAQSRVLLITGTGLSREPSRSATVFAAERAREWRTDCSSSRSIHRAATGLAIRHINTTCITRPMKLISKRFITTRLIAPKDMPFRESIRQTDASKKRSPCAMVNWC